MKNEELHLSRGEIIAGRAIITVAFILFVYVISYLSGYDICKHPTKGLYIASISESDWVRTWDDGTDYTKEKIWLYHDLFTGEEKRLWVIEIASRTDNFYDYVYDLPARQEDRDIVENWRKQFASHPLKP